MTTHAGRGQTTPVGALLPALVLALAAAGLAGPATPVHAQAVLGRTVAGSTDAALAGVFVTLTDDAGRQAAGFLSRSDGGFLIRAPDPGRYVLRAEMIGYRSVERSVELGADETARATLRLPLEAVRLEGIVARGTRQRECALGADEGDALSRLWSEARKGLRIAEWAEETGWIRAQGYTYQRVLELAELEVLAETVQRARSLEPSAFVAPDPETVRAEGFILASRGDGAVYHGADAALLLSDAFLETHCFGLRERPADGLVGLTFEPTPGRDLPDISGVLWLDAGTARLHSLEYAYTRYPVNFPLPESQFGGLTEFRHLPGGGVAVERWRIRMPSLRHWAEPAELRSARRCGMAACDDRETLRQLSRAGLAIEEEGGEVLSFRFADGTTLPAAERAAIAGEVIDSTVTGAPEPLVGADVTIQGTDHRAVTDDRGRFRLDDLPEGTYRLRFHHPRLVELGVERPEAVLATAAPGGVARAMLATPSWATLAKARCAARAEEARAGETPARPNGAAGRVIHGEVRDAATGASIGGARVRLLTAAGAATGAEAETDPTGRYLFCDAPPDATRLAADYLGKGGREVEVAAGRAGDAGGRSGAGTGDPVRADLELVLSTSARLLGRVIRAEDEAGVGGAVVRIRETGQRTVTDASGRFAFDSVAPGALSLETEHIAYRPSEGVVAVSGGELVRVELRVADEVFELEPLIVTTRSRPLMDRRMGGFYSREARGMGTFIGRDDFDRQPNAKLTRLIDESAHGFHVTWTGTGNVIRSRRKLYVPRGGAENEWCSPMIYLDGTRITNRFLRNDLEDAARLLDGIPATELAGVEIYPGPATVPGEFAGLDTDCGVIAVWTRVSDHTPDSW